MNNLGVNILQLGKLLKTENILQYIFIIFKSCY